MKNLIIKTNYLDPSKNDLEIIERKGLGHPDTLADKLAEECSRAYSNYCIENFGCVLHHNFDKLYIGAGCFRYENNVVNMYQPIKVFLNGRASNTMNGQKIDLENLMTPIIKKYIASVLPRVDVENELEVHINCTQNTKVHNWFTPESIDDIPDAKKVFANDTSLCVAHYPLTICEEIVLNIEQFFWNYNDGIYASPKFDDIGQDIKVMLSRIENKITISICLPVYPDKFDNNDEYIKILQKYEILINENLQKIANISNYDYKIEVNKMADGNYLFYSLCKGSCIECGEEGVVGRGNKTSGLISSFRPHSMEAPYGKNERYHTGRVLSFLADRSARRIYEEYGIKASIFCLTKNKNNLLDPFLIYLSIDRNEHINEIKNILAEEFDENTYLQKILKKENPII